MAHGLVLQNDTLDPPALLGDWLDERGIPFQVARVFEDGVPPDPRAFDWIAAMGSRHSVTAPDPGWIPAEVELLRAAVAEDVPVLGICFGGQALAAALGGRISAAEPPDGRLVRDADVRARPGVPRPLAPLQLGALRRPGRGHAGRVHG